MPGNESASPGSTHDAESAGAPPRRVKVHPRCVYSQQHLISTLDRLCKGDYTIEIRHNMYIIKTEEPLDQNKLVEELLGSRNNDGSSNDNDRLADSWRAQPLAAEGSLARIAG